MKYFITPFILLYASCSLLSGPHYQGEKSDHFNGEHFHNYVKDTSKKSFFKYLKMRYFEEEYPDWPKDFPKVKKIIPRNKEEFQITFINHSTFLIQLDGVNILTDPIWSKRASPFSFAGPKRVIPPGVEFNNLPRIDIVILSHDHYDHMDIPTLKRLHKRDRPTILTGLGTGKFLKESSIDNFKELDWWQEYKTKNISYIFTPSQHWSGRGLRNRKSTLWGSFWIQSSNKKIYFAGDTGFGPHFEMINHKLGPPDISLLPIGAYRPRWFMKYAHMSPEEAVKAHQVLGSKLSLGMHLKTFRLSQEDYYDPEKDLNLALFKKGLKESEFRVLFNGEQLL